LNRKNSSNRTKSESTAESNLTRMPGPASGVEAIGFTASLVILWVIVFYLSHRFGIVHRAIFPLHFPILLGGMILSPLYAAAVGILAPAVLSGLSGFPTAGQSMLLMVELAVCGAATSYTVSTLIRQTQSANWIGWMQRGVAGVIAGIIAAFLGYMLISVMDVGYSGFGYFLNSFFVSFLVSSFRSFLAAIASFLILVVAVPFVGLKLRKSAHH
jgi:hypothetical protein